MVKKLEKEIFEKNFEDCLNNNFLKYSKYLDYKFNIFFELQTSIFEVTKCLILELDKATITLTNNILERLLKLGLIYNEVGISPIPIEEWNSVFGKPNCKYSSISIGNSIELCKKHEIITQIEKDFLFDTVRELMRNGFSHADAGKILKDIPETTIGFYASLTNPSDIKQVELNQISISPLQAVQIDSFAKANAAIYFEYVFGLIERIENRIIALKK